jgi:methionine-rich copper-binding protein CopC
MRLWGKVSGTPRLPVPLLFGLLFLGVLAGASWPWSSAQAQAQAIIQSSEPAAGAAVTGPDVDIVLHYNSRLDLERSRLTLRRPDGVVTPVSTGKPGPDPAVITARVAGLASGAYVLHWQVLALDGHLTHGDIPFTVGGR